MYSAIIADDSKPIQTILNDCLEIIGIKVLGLANDGKEATELVSKLKPDLVFLDISMPNYDGIYALEQIKKTNPECTVIMVTAEQNPMIHEKTIQLGASAIILKPFSIDDIKKTISTKISVNIS